MGKIWTLINGRYVKDPTLCRYPGCAAPPLPLMKHCAACLAKERVRGIQLTIKRRQDVANALGGMICAVPACGVCDPSMLEFDHINNDAAADGANGRGTHPIVLMRKLCRLLKSEEGLQILRARFQVLCCCHNKQKETFRARGWAWSLSIASTRLKEFGMGLVSQPHS